MTLLDVVLSTTYFQFNGDLYQQVFGASMGSPVAVAVSDMYMEALEERVIDTTPPQMKPKIWKRYIDDLFEFVKWDQRDRLTSHLNKMDGTGSIKIHRQTNQRQGVVSFSRCFGLT